MEELWSLVQAAMKAEEVKSETVVDLADKSLLGW